MNMKKILFLILLSFISFNPVNSQTTPKKQTTQIVWVQGIPTCPEDQNITGLINRIGIDNLLKPKKI